MKHYRPAQDRGHFNWGWLKTFHSFSFGDYFDPNQMGFRSLRVINEDFVAPGKGFPTHPHRDMEIITYILSGSLEHQDSMGNGSIIREGEIQYMSAGTGVTHSEFNPSSTEEVHLLQIWILPNQRGHTPRYGQKNYSAALNGNQPVLLVSPSGENDSIAIRQNAWIHGLKLKAQQRLVFPSRKDHFGWIQVAQGQVEVLGQKLNAGDGFGFRWDGPIEFSTSTSDTELLIFTLE